MMEVDTSSHLANAQYRMACRWKASRTLEQKAPIASTYQTRFELHSKTALSEFQLRQPHTQAEPHRQQVVEKS